MAPPNSGRGTWIGWGRETVYGTAVARTHWAQAVSSTLARALRHEDLPHLVQGDDAVIADSYVSMEEAGGQVEFVGRYGQFGYWLDAAMGAAATTGSVAPYTHTFSTSASLPSNTVEQILGDTGNSEVFEGCTVGEMELSIEAGRPLIQRFTLIAETGSAIGAMGTATAPTDAIVLAHHAGTLNFNSAPYKVLSASLRLNNQLARLQEVGSRFTSEPPISNFRQWEISARIAYRSDLLYTAHLAETSAALSLVFTSGTDSITISGVNCQVVTHGRPLNSAGHVVQDVTFRPRSSGTTDALTIEIVNSNANYYD